VNDVGRRITFWLLLAATIALMAFFAFWVASGSTRPLWTLDFDIERVFSLLMMLFVVTLFVERAADVIITVWRDPGKTERKALVEAGRGAIAAASTRGAVPLPNVMKVQQVVELDAERFNAGTGRIAGIVTFLMGIAAAVVGFRVMLPLVDQTSFEPLGPLQRGLFYWFDVLITGAVIGGGSEGVHQILSTIISAFKKLRRRLDT
jgi:hypothetical protein